MRAGDITARYGGDEFVVLCEDLVFPDDARALAQRLINAVAGSYTLPGLLDDVQVEIGLSVGVAVTGTYLPAADFLHAADEAMYEAKHRGGDTFVVRYLDPTETPPPERDQD